MRSYVGAVVTDTLPVIVGGMISYHLARLAPWRISRRAPQSAPAATCSPTEMPAAFCNRGARTSGRWRCTPNNRHPAHRP